MIFIDREVILLTKNGLWLSDGVEIDHEQTVRAFNRGLRRDEKGYFIQIGTDTKRIDVEDTAYFVTSVEGSDDQGYELVLSDESRRRLDPRTLRYQPGRLTCRVQVRADESVEEAKFLNRAYMTLLQGLGLDEQGYYLKIAGSRIALAPK